MAFDESILTEYAAARSLESHPIAHTLMSRSITSVTIEPSIMPARHIQAVRESSAGYFFKVND